MKVEKITFVEDTDKVSEMTLEQMETFCLRRTEEFALKEGLIGTTHKWPAATRIITQEIRSYTRFIIEVPLAGAEELRFDRLLESSGVCLVR